MGYALGAAMGAKCAAPEREVWAVVGDGGFQMSSPELATLVQDSLAVKVIVVNNGRLGMVRQWQEMFFGGRYSFTHISGPDFVSLAAAHGVAAARASSTEELGDRLVGAREHDGPYVLDVRVTPDENVYPMIAPGRPIGEMILAPHRQR
jgi:acetolactate synthase-1/2/3 large subunit